ncbi:MAG TPA: hypothetical protein DCR43_02930 [Bacteroidales bacterium]|nr:MAG: hypothetical protein A2X11_13555 [Bacteroidetes bacterium GWE2_42_24]HAQ64797.1 hypothetical protein [Bacteroidales bacterium]HBZ67966.1 hypothetical protein [Bacteroidales bacterium]
MRTQANSEERLHALNETGHRLTLARDTAHIAEAVNDHVQPLFGETRFQLFTLDEKKQTLTGIMDTEKGEKFQLFELSLSDKGSLAVWCAVHARTLFLSDIENERSQYLPEALTIDLNNATGSMACCPIIAESKVLGVLILQNSQKNSLTQFDAGLLENLARLVALAFTITSLKEQTEQTGRELEKARTQLIESERMAALGQLTAGIAHEIKNPLNFINNFSELTIELALELTQELDKLSDQLKPEDKDYLEEITGDIRSNALKINEHGKRADSIVKGMLLHARGQHADILPTDINTVLAEYVNLGYHGMRAQDAGFNIKIDAEYDQTIGMINAIPQNLSRVFLNLINNACYSTNQKKIQLKDAYFPILTVRTKNLADFVEIRIRDNGFGIPQAVIDKVFNPFFTTKPPGQGTGLGLSLSYDIITKEHHGTMTVDSVEREYAEFIITIPKNLI